MKSRYQIKHIGDGTTIIKAQGCDLPTLSLSATVINGGDLVAKTTIWRGKAFATRVAKFMLKGFLSRLGKHRRATQNRAAKRAKAQEEAI